MFPNVRQRSKNEATGRPGGNQPSSSNSHQGEVTTIKYGKGKTSEKAPSMIVHRREDKPIIINSRDEIYSVAFLIDGRHVVSGGRGGKIRHWRVDDGEEVGTPMDAGNVVCNIAVSPDGKSVASGTGSGWVMVWDAESDEKVIEFRGHAKWVCVVDVSPDGTRIATGSKDFTACVWSLSTGERLLGPLQRNLTVLVAKFSPNGRLIAIATQESVQVYDSQGGRLLIDVWVQVNSQSDQSLAWARDGKKLFVLSGDGNIHCLNVATRTTLSKWAIHGSVNARCIVLASNGTFIAASAGPSVSLWDTTTQGQIGSVIEHAHDIRSMDISANYDLVTGGDKSIFLRSLCDILPLCYFDDDNGSNERIVDLKETVQELRIQLAESRQKANRERDNLVQSLRAQEENSNSKIVPLQTTVQELRNELAKSQRAAKEQKDSLNEIIRSLRADLHAQEINLRNHEKTVERLRDQLATSQRTANQEKDSLNKIANSLRAALRARVEYSDNKITRLEQTNQELRVELAESQSLVRFNRADGQKHQCESLYAQGRVYDAVESLLQIANTESEDATSNRFIIDWLADFTQRCVKALERIGDEASYTEKQDEAAAAYSTALSLSPSTPNTVLIKWARMMLAGGSAHEALSAAAKFKVPRFDVCRAICDILEGDGHLTEVVQCFRQMQNELPDDTGTRDGQAQWERDFRGRCSEKLEKLGDIARDAKKHDEAIRYYSDALSLGPMNLNDILLKRSIELIELDPSSHKGYEEKHTALHAMGHHTESFEAFRLMLSMLEQSPDPKIRALRHEYIDATSTIQKVVEEAVRHIPHVLVDIVTGCFYDKTQQAAAFEELPIYDELRSSMTTRTRLDYSRIQREVKQFYRYVMLSHKWQPGEPTFQQVRNISIYKLPSSPAFSKLQNFCKLVLTLRFKWAWSDTCCVNQLDKGVQQESLVAMFRWYHGSSLTIVHLLGILSESQEVGCLWKSIWNTRGWTYQEYIASEAVQFYTEDWKPYLGLSIFNHKESPIILSEMEQAVNFTRQELATLRPGLDRVREKLYLASMRQTTREEDIAYSLFGIFNVAIPVIYGEGNRAVSRLLEHILTGSGDVTILAWTGRAGSYNSCLPVDLTVYNRLLLPHVPPSIETGEMDTMVAALRSSLPDLSLAVMLLNHLNKLPSPSIAASRLRLAGIIFPVTELAPTSESDANSDMHVYRATTAALGDVEIKTMDDLSRMEDVILIHPWISPLLDQEFSRRTAGLDDTTRALRLIARLRQPFGALLLTPLSRVQYRRVATDSLIMVQVREDISVHELIDGIRTVDIQ